MKDTEPKEAKVIPISPSGARDIGDIVEKSFNLANSGSDHVGNELWSTELNAFLDSHTLKSLFFSEDWVYIIVDLTANKISGQPLRVMQKTTSEDGEEVLEEAPEHPLNELLRQPNQWQDYAQFMYNVAVELFLMGNAIIWSAKKSGQLMTIPTEQVSIDFDPDGRVNNYMISSIRQDDTGLHEVTGTMSIDAKEIIHVRRTNPSSLMWGLSPFISGRKSVLFNRYSSDYLNAFYLKQATPGLALSLDRNVNEDVALRQLRSFEMAFQGRKNMRKTLILPKGVEAKALTHSLSDQKLIDHIKLNRETICGLLKVPKHELGLQEAGSLGSEEHKLALRNFWEATLLPGMGLIEGMFNKFFQAELGEDFVLKFDTDDVPALKDDMQKKADIAAKMLQAGLSINQVLTQVWNQEPSEDPAADSPYLLVQSRSQAFNFSPSVDPEEEGDTKALITGKTKLRATERVEQIRCLRIKQLENEESRTIGQLSRFIIDMLIGMTKTALDVIEASNKSMPAMATKDLPSKRKLARRIKDAIEDTWEESWEAEVSRTLDKSVEIGYDQSLDGILGAAAVQEIQALRERDAEGRRATLSARGLEAFDKISDTHTEAIMQEITEGQERNESITQLMRRVTDALGGAEQITYRAERIARTETLVAVSLGQAAATENAKEVIPGLKKTWLTAGDDRVRDTHRPLDGDTIPVDEKFDNGLRHPRDIKSNDASEVINCRCTLLLIPPDAEDLPFEIPQPNE